MLKLLQGGKQDRIRPEVRKRFPARAETAHRITLARELAGSNHWEAAKRTGLSMDWIRMVESGLVEVTSKDIRAFSDAYAVSQDWLLCRVPEQADPAELGPSGPSLTPEVRFRMLTILASCKEVPRGQASVS